MTSILDQAVPVSETVESINMVLYGNPGSGKTTFAGSGPNQGKDTLIIATEHGTKSAARAGSKAQVIHADDWETLAAVVEAVVAEPDRYDWVVLDSLTKMQDVIWKEIVDSSVERNPSRSPYKKELQEYGEAQERLKAVVRRLNSSDANIIYTAMADVAVDEDGNEYRLPSIHGQQGALAWWLCGEVDVVCYLSVGSKNGKQFRGFRFNNSEKALAKDRFDLFDKGQENLTLEKYTELVLAKSEEEAESEEAAEKETSK